MCIDPETQILYVFGGRTMRVDPKDFSHSGLYAYEIAKDTWTLLRWEIVLNLNISLCELVISVNSIHVTLISVQGNSWSSIGIVVDGCSFCICQWRPDIRSDLTKSQQGGQLKSRIGHSMLFDPKEKLLYIFAGQREKEYLR